MRALLCLLLLAFAAPVQASEIIGALSQNRVALTANFSGSQILIFGAIRRSAEEVMAEARPDAPPLPEFDVIIVIEGPRQRAEVWRKERRAGIWMNVDSLTLGSVPSFYAVASSAPLNAILTPEQDAEFRISPHQAIRAEQLAEGGPEAMLFAEALLRIRERSAHFLTLERFVHLDSETLFRANVQLPANLTEGAYTTRMYLVQEGRVVSQYRTAIFVRKDGLERWLHELAYAQPLLYGLLALAIALVAGWGASAVVRIIRQS